MKVRALDAILPTRARNCLYTYGPYGSDDWTEQQWKDFVLSHTMAQILRIPDFGRRSLLDVEDWLGASLFEPSYPKREPNTPKAKLVRDAEWNCAELDRLNREIKEIQAKLKTRIHMRKILREILAKRETAADSQAA